MTAEEKNLASYESVDRFERADRLIPSGVFVVTLQSGRRVNAYTAAWVVRVSEDPVIIQVAVWEQNYSYTLAQDCNDFVVHILASGQQDTALHFGRCSGRDLDKLQEYSTHPGVSKIPILDDCLAYLECEVVFRHKFGDHMVLMGKVVNTHINHRRIQPLIYDHKD
ncbi:MAG: flavin reductase family protein, partial [candidate division WOR-3 bacterium]|nr:flavin reductase family protein [candidate division WOR-3 bacterium]